MSTVTESTSWFLIAILVTTFAGCAAVGPDYKRPDVPVYEEWHARLDGKANPESLAQWWTTFNDTKLTHLIERAVKGNFDLKKARAQVREARARRGIAESGLLPSLNGSGSASWTRTTGNGVANATSNGNSELYSANFDASWELDVFGGVRRSVEAARGDLQASDESLCNVLVSLLSEVALNYFDVRTYQDRLKVAADNLQSQSETHELTQWRFQAGLADELAVQQAHYNLENTRSQIPDLRAGLDAAMNRIAVLLGEQPGAVHDELDNPEAIPVPPLQVAVGVPADLLRRRPDVRQAERELAAQTARIGVATADLYPKLTLSGSIGLETLSIRNLSSGTMAISGGPSISWAIFKGGAIRQNIKLQSALQEEALAHYESVILGALEEVENALRAYIETQERRKSLSVATRAAQKAAELAQTKYQAGLTDFTSVLDAQRSLLSFQEQLTVSNGNVSANLVRVYKALGGGWTSLSSNPEIDGL